MLAAWFTPIEWDKHFEQLPWRTQVKEDLRALHAVMSYDSEKPPVIDATALEQ